MKPIKRKYSVPVRGTASLRQFIATAMTRSHATATMGMGAGFMTAINTSSPPRSPPRSPGGTSSILSMDRRDRRDRRDGGSLNSPQQDDKRCIVTYLSLIIFLVFLLIIFLIFFDIFRPKHRHFPSQTPLFCLLSLLSVPNLPFPHVYIFFVSNHPYPPSQRKRV